MNDQKINKTPSFFIENNSPPPHNFLKILRSFTSVSSVTDVKKIDKGSVKSLIKLKKSITSAFFNSKKTDKTSAKISEKLKNDSQSAVFDEKRQVKSNADATKTYKK